MWPASNLALTYWHRNDQAGLPYALRVLEYGREQRDPMHVFTAMPALQCITCSATAARRSDTSAQTVGWWIASTIRRGLPERQHSPCRRSGTGGRRPFPHRLSHLDEAEATSAVDYYLGYGRFLIDAARYREAASVLRQGIAVAGRSGNTVSRYACFSATCRWFTAVWGLPRRARLFRGFTIRVGQHLFGRARALMMKCRSGTRPGEKENELRQKQYEVLKERRKVQISRLLAAIAAVPLVVWVLYRRKMRSTSASSASIRRRSAGKSLAGAFRSRRDAGGEVCAFLADRREEPCALRGLERLMRSERIYRQRDLTRSGSPRSPDATAPTSQVVNAQTGMNMVSYINSFRIQEAVELLSDAGSEIPLKAVALEAGFSSLSTFYKLFKQTVGMTPLKFREKVAELARSRARNTL
ncbi:MAG: helix-turn-helix domain-containing protein [Alistipes sp.]